MSLCPKCGKAVLPAASFCVACGARVVGQPDGPEAAATGMKGGRDTSTLIQEGVGIGNTLVDKSTRQDVTANLGDGFRLVAHGDYSCEMVYDTLGLSFFYLQKDDRQTIFSIHIAAPFQGATTRGIVLGRHTMHDVVKVYGPPNWRTSHGSKTWWSEYDGVQFHVDMDASVPTFPLDENLHLPKTITRICLFRPPSAAPQGKRKKRRRDSKQHGQSDGRLTRNVVQLDSLASAVSAFSATGPEAEAILLLQQTAKTTMTALRVLRDRQTLTTELDLMDKVVDAVLQEAKSATTREAAHVVRQIIQSGRAGSGGQGQNTLADEGRDLCAWLENAADGLAAVERELGTGSAAGPYRSTASSSQPTYSHSTDMSVGEAVGITIGLLILGALAGGLFGAVQFGVEHFLRWQSGTTFLMHVSGATLMGTLLGGLIAGVIVSFSSPSFSRDQDAAPPVAAGVIGGLVGALCGGLAGLFGWTQTVLDPSRGFHLPSVLDRLFGVHWSPFWERVAGSAASVMVVLGLSGLLGLLGLLGIWPYRAHSRFGQLLRCVLVMATMLGAAWWLANLHR